MPAQQLSAALAGGDLSDGAEMAMVIKQCVQREVVIRLPTRGLMSAAAR